MISFTKLGQAGRLGNQLFQYAFLRSTARRLETLFWCPEWMGDRIFHLDDDAERARKLVGIDKQFVAPLLESGFDMDALGVRDGTDIHGLFQSPKFFCDPLEVRRWYTFRANAVAAVLGRYRDVPLRDCVALHLRLGDKGRNPDYYSPPFSFYRNALSTLGDAERLLVFSDDPAAARLVLRPLGGDPVFVEGNADYEDLFLISRCGGVVCSPSTFCWWGAWLGAPGRRVVAPREGPFRRGAAYKNTAYWPEEWIQIRALRRVRDSYAVAAVRWRRRWRPRSLYLAARRRCRALAQRLRRFGRAAVGD